MDVRHVYRHNLRKFHSILFINALYLMHQLDATLHRAKTIRSGLSRVGFKNRLYVTERSHAKSTPGAPSLCHETLCDKEDRGARIGLSRVETNIRDLQISVRVGDWVRVRLSNFKSVASPKLSLLPVVYQQIRRL